MRRLVLAFTLSCLAFLSCELLTDPPTTGGLEIRVSRATADSAALARAATIDGARARVTGPSGDNSTTIVRNLTLRNGTAFIDTIAGLAPGSYTVALEGTVGSAVEEFGETSGVTVTAGENNIANVTVNSFRPSVQVAPITDSLAIRVTVGSVTGADQYMVSWSDDSLFGAASDTTTANTSVRVDVPRIGRFFARARAINAYSATGVWSDTAGADVDVTAASVAVTPNARTMTSLGDSLQLSATAMDGGSNAIPGKLITWSASAGNVLTVDSTGLVVATAQGTAIVTASADLVNGTATITVDQAIDSIEVTAPADTLSAGMSYQFSATGYDIRGNGVSGTTFTWQTSDSTIATIDGSGMLTGVGGGNVTVSAFAEGKVGTKTVFLLPLTAVVVMTPTNDTLTFLGDTLRVTAVAEDPNGVPIPGKPFQWATSDSAIATVDAAGLVTAIGSGTATVTATADTASGSATIEVDQIADSVAVTAPGDSLITGAPHQFVAAAFDLGRSSIVGASFTWASSDSSNATVDSLGVVIGLLGGPVTISATADGVTGTKSVFFWPPAAAVTVTPDTSVMVSLGDTTRLSAVAMDSSAIVIPGKVFTWSSSDSSIVTVDSAGLVTAIANGTVDISAATDTVVGSAAVVVSQVVDSLVVAGPGDTLLTGLPHQFSTSAFDARGNTVGSATVTWETSDSSVATVDTVGVVIGVAHDSTWVIATADSVRDSVSVFFWPPAASVVLTPSLDSLDALGDTARVTATAQDSVGAAILGKQFTWSISNSAVAMVDSTGLVTAVANGTAFLDATTDSVTSTAATIVVDQAVQSIDVTAPGNTIFVNASYQFLAEALDPGGSVVTGTPLVWESSDSSVALVDAMGLVMTIDTGTVTIMASGGGQTGTATVSVLPGALPATDLWAHLPFDGHANDVVAPNRYGTVNGATLTADRFGTSNSAYAFDGSQGYIALGSWMKPALPFTISGWIKAADTTRAQEIIISSDPKWGLYYYGWFIWKYNGSLQFQYGNGGFSGGGSRREWTTQEPVLTEGRWQHFAIIMTAWNDIRIYVDGQLRPGMPANGSATSGPRYSASNGYIGGGGGLGYFQGELDDFRVYSRALSQSEILGLVAEGGYMRPVVDSVAIQVLDSLATQEGYDLGFTAQLYDASGAPVYGISPTWSSSDSNVAVVDQLGNVDAIAPGTAVIRASKDNGADSVVVDVAGPGVAFQDVSTGYRHSCATTTSGQAYCWGYNGQGQLGDASQSTSYVPVAVQGGGLTFDSISVHTDQTCALTPGGVAYCWGSNSDGQLGDSTGGSGTNRIIPTAVVGGLAFTSITAGRLATCARTAAGLVYCWGRNVRGELGDSLHTARSYPDTLYGGRRWSAMKLGSHTGCAVEAVSGDAYCWGGNSSGQFGNGTTTDVPFPTPVTTGLTFTAISTDAYITNGIYGFTCGIAADSTAYCWGRNSDGQLGDNSTTNRLLPVAVAGGHKWKVIDVGQATACGITTAGRLYCWGDNSRGSVGDGTFTDRLIPTPVLGPRTYEDISINVSAVCGRSTSGALYCWGANGNGQVGDGTTADRNVPTRVPDP